jgi:hypothetical protein
MIFIEKPRVHTHKQLQKMKMAANELHYKGKGKWVKFIVFFVCCCSPLDKCILFKTEIIDKWARWCLNQAARSWTLSQSPSSTCRPTTSKATPSTSHNTATKKPSSWSMWPASEDSPPPTTNSSLKCTTSSKIRGFSCWPSPATSSSARRAAPMRR